MLIVQVDLPAAYPYILRHINAGSLRVSLPSPSSLCSPMTREVLLMHRSGYLVCSGSVCHVLTQRQIGVFVSRQQQ
jgi:hypothetical protein